MNLFIVDLETTGLDPSVHEIIEIGCVNVTTGETFEVKVRPLHIKDAQPEALKVNGYNEADWEEAFLLPNALKLLTQFLYAGDDVAPRYMMAYNVSFDRAFLEKAYRDCNMVYPFHYNHLDLLTMVWDRHWNRLEVTSLKNTCKALSIPPEPEVHRALGGAQAAFEVYKKLTTSTSGDKELRLSNPEGWHGPRRV